MFTRQRTHPLLSGLCICLLLIATACSTQTSANQRPGSISSIPASDRPTAGNLPGANGTTGTAATTCPASGTGRAAVMPALHLGPDQTIVYIDAASALKRYDVQTGRTTTLLQAGGSIRHAQISRDGQWILFTVENESIRLVRVDGKYLQTLYCASQGKRIDPESASGFSSAVQWSPDQHEVIFSQ